MPRRRRARAARRSSPGPAARRTCRACWRPRPGCRCSACRCSRRRSPGSIRCSRSCRCRRASRSARWRSARRARRTPGCSPRRCWRPADAGARRPARRLAGGADRGGRGGARWRLSRCRPGSRIGILGGGQLGRMLAMAAARLGMRTHVFEPAPDAPAAQVANALTRAGYDDAAALARLRRARSTSSPTSSRTCRSRRSTPSRRWRRCGPGGGRSRSRRTGWPRRTFLSGIGLATAPYAAVDGPDGARGGAGADRRAGDPEDPAPRLRRQGAGAARRRRVGAARPGRRSAARRRCSRASSASSARSR